MILLLETARKHLRHARRQTSEIETQKCRAAPQPRCSPYSEPTNRVRRPADLLTRLCVISQLRSTERSVYCDRYIAAATTANANQRIRRIESNADVRAAASVCQRYSVPQVFALDDARVRNSSCRALSPLPTATDFATASTRIVIRCDDCDTAPH